MLCCPCHSKPPFACMSASCTCDRAVSCLCPGKVYRLVEGYNAADATSIADPHPTASLSAVPQDSPVYEAELPVPLFNVAVLYVVLALLFCYFLGPIYESALPFQVGFAGIGCFVVLFHNLCHLRATWIFARELRCTVADPQSSPPLRLALEQATFVCKNLLRFCVYQCDE